MRNEDASLAEAFDEYAADARLRLKRSTWRTYDHYIPAFIASGAAQLRDLTPLRVKAFVNRYTLQGKVHGAHNAMIALRAFATWLANEKVFFAPGGSSTLAGLALPSVPKKSRPAYTPDEVQKIERVIASHPHAPLLSAVHWLQLGTGIRSNETRLLLIRDVVLPATANDFQGHIVVREESTKTEAGVREIPLDPKAAKAIRRYITSARPVFHGHGAEPLFLTKFGVGYTDWGWLSLHRRLRQVLQRRGIPGYMQHRNRNTWARDALEAGIPETAIVQMGGWGSVDMLRRYHGKMTTAQLKRYPTTLAKYGASRDSGLERALV